MNGGVEERIVQMVALVHHLNSDGGISLAENKRPLSLKQK